MQTDGIRREENESTGDSQSSRLQSEDSEGRGASHRITSYRLPWLGVAHCAVLLRPAATTGQTEGRGNGTGRDGTAG